MNVGYIRVSTIDQNPARQREALTAAGVEKIFEDVASGKDAERSELKAMMAFLRDGDNLTIASLDRLARSLTDLLRIVDDLGRRGVKVVFLKENLVFAGGSDADPAARLMLQLVGAFAEFERTIIRIRQREGIELAKKRGVYCGRAQVVTREQINIMKEQISFGVPVSKVARSLGLSRSTVYRYIKGA